MRCLAVCQTELLIRMLDEALAPSFDVELLVESKPLARKLHDAGVTVYTGDPKRTDTYIKADVTPATCVIVDSLDVQTSFAPMRIVTYSACCAIADCA